MLMTVTAFMWYQITLTSECLTTYITGKWTLTSVYTIMSYQATLLSK